MDIGRGRLTGILGTVATVIGALVILVAYDRPGWVDDFAVGGLLVLGGLLLRIEAAIHQRGGRTAGPAPTAPSNRP
ncbi:hypothetical protein [Micromonospora sediminicola]|uniref:hypothetical protein n=1 Tax=Micromonospora sediminicola TaxID=946078 RepID=UPI0033C9BBA2